MRKTLCVRTISCMLGRLGKTIVRIWQELDDRWQNVCVKGMEVLHARRPIAGVLYIGKASGMKDSICPGDWLDIGQLWKDIRPYRAKVGRSTAKHQCRKRRRYAGVTCLAANSRKFPKDTLQGNETLYIAGRKYARIGMEQEYLYDIAKSFRM